MRTCCVCAAGAYTEVFLKFVHVYVGHVGVPCPHRIFTCRTGAYTAYRVPYMYKSFRALLIATQGKFYTHDVAETRRSLPYGIAVVDKHAEASLMRA